MKNIINKIARLALAGLIAAAPSVNFAALIPISADYQMVTYTQELDVQKMASIALELQKHYTLNPARYIPAADMPLYSSDQSQIAGKILRHTVQTWIDEDYIEFDFVKKAKVINESLSTEFAVADNNRADAGKFKFRFRPVTAEAQLRYEGSFNANLSYDIADSTAKLQIAWTF